MRKSPPRQLGVAVAVAGMLAAFAGCGEPTPDEIHAGDFGYTSIRLVQINVSHVEAGFVVSLVAELTPSDADTCPPLDPDFAITANGAAPTWMALDPNEGDAIVLFDNCRIHQLDADFELPADTRSVRLDFSQRSAGGFIELAIPEQTTMQIGAPSTTSVPLGGTFTADVTLTPTPAGRIGGSNCWYGHHCPRENPDCIAGEGLSGLVITEAQPNDATIHLVAQVPDGSFTGARTLFIGTVSFFGCLDVPLPVVRQTVDFGSYATTDVKNPMGFGPFELEVTEAGSN
jgi:hypothetical protein